MALVFSFSAESVPEGARVREWCNEVNTELNAVSISGSEELAGTTLPNGARAVRFWGNTVLQLTFPFPVGECTLVAVAQADAGAPSPFQRLCGSKQDQRLYFGTLNDEFNVSTGTEERGWHGFDQTYSEKCGVGAPRVWTATVDTSGTLRTFVNGKEVGSARNGLMSAFNDFHIGGGGECGQNFYGTCSALQLYAKALSEEERAAVEAQLMTKYGIEGGRTSPASTSPADATNTDATNTSTASACSDSCACVCCVAGSVTGSNCPCASSGEAAPPAPAPAPAPAPPQPPTLMTNELYQELALICVAKSPSLLDIVPESLRTANMYRAAVAADPEVLRRIAPPFVNR